MGIKVSGLAPEKIKVEWTEELPICPYCLKELDKIEAMKRGHIVSHITYRCPYCKKLLGIGSDVKYRL